MNWKSGLLVGVTGTIRSSAAVMKIPVIVQARMSSKRLPGKMLLAVNGRPLLDYVVGRLRQGESISTVVVATSDETSDTPLAAFCEMKGIPCVRGPLDNVAARFKIVVETYGFKNFVRICGDSPFIDAGLIDTAIGHFADGGHHIVTNLLPRTFPMGQSVEVLDTAAFLDGFFKMTRSNHLEHVTPYFYEHSDDYRIFNFESPQGDFSSFNFCVDEPGDVQRMAAVLNALKRPLEEYDWNELITVYHQVEKGVPI